MFVHATHLRAGDVIKFAGDALICLFTDRGPDGPGGAAGDATTCVPGIARARDCSVELLRALEAKRGTPDDDGLEMHAGIAAGDLCAVHVGLPHNVAGSSGFMLAGDALNEAGYLMDEAGKGEVRCAGVAETITSQTPLLYPVSEEDLRIRKDARDEKDPHGLQGVSIAATGCVGKRWEGERGEGGRGRGGKGRREG